TADYEKRLNLFTAYLAGNIKSQILTRNGDDPYAGLLQVLATYEQLQSADNTFSNQEVEDIKAVYEKGQLRAHIDN
ncbi:MAG: hypothetical protein OET90_09515, partial [Desulfuromonadales bacterium]|nr:hypothetical protein [Desulfuromonadales bacterium]